MDTLMKTASGQKEKLHGNELVLCMSIGQARTVDIMMIVAACGFDAVYVDLEHTATSIETASMLCAASIGYGLIPMVRVPSHDHQYMTRAIDTGAVGIIVPHVNTRAEAEHIVEVCKFPPVGHRSVVGPNPVTRFRQMPMAEMVDFLNRETILTAMLETPQAIERADEIASVPGLDMILIGSADLSCEMGIVGQFRNPKFREAVAVACDACRKHGKVMGIAGIKHEIDLLTEFVGMGVRFISPGTDAGFFMEAARSGAERLRAIPVPGTKS